jgi:hypothetical protein
VDGKIRMSRVTLRPHIVLELGVNEARARELVAKAHEGCFIANSVSTPVDIEPTFVFLPKRRLLPDSPLVSSEERGHHGTRTAAPDNRPDRKSLSATLASDSG